MEALPQQLTDGLELRWATPNDAEALAQFNAAIHEEGPDEAGIIYYWTLDLMSGQHPTTSAAQFTMVVDKNEGDKIVSTLCTIPQVWSYDGISFPVGRPEIVGTLPDYRQRGLVRRQMEAIHAQGATRGELMQAITGIPWYYRQFGYEMALDLGGGRRYMWERQNNLVHLKAEDEPYTWQQATVDDIPILSTLYERHCQASMIATPRDETLWRYEMEGQHEKSVQFRHRWLIRHKEQGFVGYVQFAVWGGNIVIHELAAVEGHSLRAVCLYLTRMFKGYANIRREKAPDKPRITGLIFRLGQEHPAYEALGRQLERFDRPYAWYIRFPDVAGFLRRIQPKLEERLADSVMAGHTGTLKLNFYHRGTMTLDFKDGQLTDIGTFKRQRLGEGDARFPEYTFNMLLCGRHTLREINAIYPDCFGTAEAEVLLGILFPKRSSQPLGLG